MGSRLSQRLWPRWTYAALAVAVAAATLLLFSGLGMQNKQAAREVAIFVGLPLVLLLVAFFFAAARAGRPRKWG